MRGSAPIRGCRGCEYVPLSVPVDPDSKIPLPRPSHVVNLPLVPLRSSVAHEGTAQIADAPLALPPSVLLLLAGAPLPQQAVKTPSSPASPPDTQQNFAQHCLTFPPTTLNLEPACPRPCCLLACLLARHFGQGENPQNLVARVRSSSRPLFGNEDE